MARRRVPEYEPIARYIQRFLDICQTNVYRFATSHGEDGKVLISYSTLSGWVNAQTKPDPTKAVNFAKAAEAELLLAFSKNLIDQKDVKKWETIYQELMSLIPGENGSAIARKTPEFTQPSAIEIKNWFRFHFSRLEPAEQLEIVEDVLTTVGRAMSKLQDGLDDDRGLSELVADIKADMELCHVDTIEDYAGALLSKNKIYSRNHEDYASLVEGLNTLISRSEALEVDSTPFMRTIYYLAEHMLDGKYGGDSAKVLYSYGILRSDSISEAELEEE